MLRRVDLKRSRGTCCGEREGSDGRAVMGGEKQGEWQEREGSVMRED